jgi:transcription elongation factor GreA
LKKSVNITLDGKKELEKELEELIAQRPVIAERIAVARAFGDLSENEEYSSARGEQKVLESRIIEIQDILQNALIIRATKREKIAVGATVVVKDGKKEITYVVVGPVEANPLEGKISNESPIGKALLGKKVGEEAVIETARGKKKYTVVEIK